ncbi:PspC domain-containing protein [Paenibacillus sp. LHD-117]|uniref:PspC domain-containing protein n=1 Tax=Paenibacillus sp. LHD-117 TaxID=3071412 RepID=UPI0027E0C8DB|nr:PspC domain-containing protein [Paenibacillus sp. LHD-117]MDQ6423382.1 PspC domain-containing protein [Paenibacillus sp. LHD-117]
MVILRKLYRSRRDKKLLGLCGGLSEMLNVDATLLRILLVVVTIFTSGTVIFIYLIAGLVIPKEPPIYNGYGPGGFGPNGFGSGHGGGYGGGYSGGYNNGGYGSHSGPQGSYNASFGQTSPQEQWGYRKDEPAATTGFDSMMDDLEKKALRREIEELKAKIAKYEKGE